MVLLMINKLLIFYYHLIYTNKIIYISKLMNKFVHKQNQFYAFFRKMSKTYFLMQK